MSTYDVNQESGFEKNEASGRKTEKFLDYAEIREIEDYLYEAAMKEMHQVHESNGFAVAHTYGQSHEVKSNASVPPEKKVLPYVAEQENLRDQIIRFYLEKHPGNPQKLNLALRSFNLEQI